VQEKNGEREKALSHREKKETSLKTFSGKTKTWRGAFSHEGGSQDIRGQGKVARVQRPKSSKGTEGKKRLLFFGNCKGMIS